MTQAVRWVLAGALAAGAVVTIAGPLSPPAGPVGTTYKTLSEVEPRIPVQSLRGDATALYVISQPGSYYLTGNITAAPDKNGIRVGASDVTIDLRGFHLDGARVFGDAIHADPALMNLTVRNGSASDWRGAGVSAGGCAGGRLEDLTVRDSGWGLSIGPGSEVRHCILTDVGGPGISGDADCRVVECVALRTGGINLGNGVNGGFVASCVCNGGGSGILVGDGGGITGCTARGNNSSGLACDRSTIEGSTSTGNGEGIQVLGGSVTRCTASRNSAIGIEVWAGGSVLNCTETANGAEGILGVSSVVLRQNTCVGNTLSGIRIAQLYSDVEGNLCNANGGAGVDTTTSGYYCSVLANLLAGNTGAAINTPSFGQGYIGAIIVSPASGFTSTDPTANFTY